MDNSGLSLFDNISCPSSGERLLREDMEKYVIDIDVFLILYDESLYRISCSGSILESISYKKPIIHFNNDCIDFFNNSKLPIGVRVNSIDDYANTMVNYIENYEIIKNDFILYKNNIEILREKYKIENNIKTIKDSFTW
jgi:hypothetical protein